MLKYFGKVIGVKTVNLAPWCVCALALSACASVETNTIIPQDPSDLTWSSALMASANAELAPPTRWWQNFNDAALNSLVEAAVLDNLDLELARNRVIEARSLANIDRAASNPSIGLGGSITEQRQSETSVFPVGRIPNFNADNTIYSFGFDAAWELDLFGRRRLVDEIGLLQVESSEESKRDLLVSLLAEVARTYFDLRAAQLELQTIKSIVSSQAELVELTRIKRDFGEATNFDVERSEALKLDYEARLPQIAGQVRTNLVRLNILKGQPPATPLPAVEQFSAVFTAPIVPAIGLTSDLLRRRPDVRRAERHYLLAAKQADLTKVSTYPRFSLFGSAGPETVDIADFLAGKSIAIALGAMLNWDLYDGGRDSAEAKVVESKLEQARIGYRQTILVALEDVEVAVSNYIAAAETANKRQALVLSQRTLTDIAGERYNAGVGTLLEVLDSQRRLGDALVGESRASAAQAIALIALYKALGGGWETFEKLTTS
jgi:NodT family efflux transporter outer membrane factor (OMF) lipoprotein